MVDVEEDARFRRLFVEDAEEDVRFHGLFAEDAKEDVRFHWVFAEDLAFKKENQFQFFFLYLYASSAKLHAKQRLPCASSANARTK